MSFCIALNVPFTLFAEPTTISFSCGNRMRERKEDKAKRSNERIQTEYAKNIYWRGQQFSEISLQVYLSEVVISIFSATDNIKQGDNEIVRISCTIRHCLKRIHPLSYSKASYGSNRGMQNSALAIGISATLKIQHVEASYNSCNLNEKKKIYSPS